MAADYEVIPTTRKQIPQIHRLICQTAGRPVPLAQVIQVELGTNAMSISAVNPVDPGHVRGFVTARILTDLYKTSPPGYYQIGCLCTADAQRVDIASKLLLCLIERCTQQLTAQRPTFTLVALMPEENRTLYVSHGFQDGGPAADGRHLYTLTRTFIPE